jgi:hypothetical protein
MDTLHGITRIDNLYVFPFKIVHDNKDYSIMNQTIKGAIVNCWVLDRIRRRFHLEYANSVGVPKMSSVMKWEMASDEPI